MHERKDGRAVSLNPMSGSGSDKEVKRTDAKSDTRITEAYLGAADDTSAVGWAKTPVRSIRSSWAGINLRPL